MRHKGKVTWLVTAALLVTAGCQHLPFVGGFVGASAGPYKVMVTDALTGQAIEGAMVGWDYYFTSETVDPAQRPALGVSLTDAEGVATIPEAQYPRGDRFDELNVDVTVAGYMEVKKKITSRGGTIKLELIPIDRVNP